MLRLDAAGAMLKIGEFLHLLADRAVNGLPKLFVERMLVAGR